MIVYTVVVHAKKHESSPCYEVTYEECKSIKWETNDLF